MQLKLEQFCLKLANTWTIARGSADNVPIVLVGLKSPDGTSAIGEASPISRYQESVESVEVFIRGLETDALSFSNLPTSLDYIRNCAEGNMAAKCAVDIAILDGAAKLAKQPLHSFLGLGFAENRHVTSFSIGIDSPDRIREKVLAAKFYPVLKLKVGGPNDRVSLDALREVEPHKPVRVDANEAWPNKELALEKLEWLASDGHIQFVEQPMPATTPPSDLAWLKERSPLPLFGDESYHTAKDADHCAEFFHGVNVKLVKAGGISGGFDALKAARKQGLKTMLGCMIETSVLISAGAHLAELCDYLDLDGNLLTTNDPYSGVTAEKGVLSFSKAPEPFGLRVGLRNNGTNS